LLVVAVAAVEAVQIPPMGHALLAVVAVGI
jgi:hypothetical protein